MVDTTHHPWNLAVFLLGAITHQAVGLAWPITKKGSCFFQAVRCVNGMSYTNAVIILFAVTFAIGTIIYPTFRISVRIALPDKPEDNHRGKDALVKSMS